MLLACLLCLTGCPPRPALQGPPPPAETPSYAQLAQRYNRKIAGLTQLWAATSVHLTWTQNGKEHSERGEGNVIVVLPDQTAFTFGKVGQTGLWAGCDATRYWYFDFRGEGTAYVGRHTHADLDARNPMGVPVRPLDVPKLLGIMPLDPNALSPGGGEPAVRWDGGAWLVEPPGMHLRLWIDPRSDLAQRLELLDGQAHPTATATLSSPDQLPSNGVPQADWPWINQALRVELADGGGTLEVRLNSANDGRYDGVIRIKPLLFDFDRLVRTHEPAKVVDVDQEP
jgi:hypothetical protein